MPLLRALGAMGACWVIAWAYRRSLRWSGWLRSSAWLLASFLTALTPCLVPLTERPYRFVAAIAAVATLAKLYDLFQQPLDAPKMSLRSYALYVINWFWLVLRKPPPSVPAAADRRRLVLTAPVSLLMVGACSVLFSLDYSGVPFAVEHSVKVFVLVETIVLCTNTAASAWRLLGGVALTPMLRPAGARTPADFWRRWNRSAQQFFYEYGFAIVGGVHHPVRGILMAFGLSGLAHEYVFGITAGHVQGWQLLYFMLQGAATVATIRLRPNSWKALPCVAATIAFNVALAVLFFKSVNAVVPFYSPRYR